MTDLIDRVAESITGWPLNCTNSEEADAWRACARLAMEAIADWLVEEGEAEQVRYEAAESFHALSPLSCNRLVEARRFAAALREGK